MAITRLTGMASGLDTDSTVKQLMKPYTAKLDKMKQDRQIVQWKQDLYRDIISDTKLLKKNFLDYANPATNMLSASNYSMFDASADSTGTVSLTAGASAAAGTYSVKVDALAAGATLSGNVGVPVSTKLKDIGGTGAGITAGGTLNITVNGAATPIAVTIDPNKTIGDLVSSINTAGAGTLKAAYNELTGQFSIATKATGVGNTISITGFDLSKLGINPTNPGDLSVPTNGVVGHNADVMITEPGGAPVHLTNQTNNIFTLDGVTYNLLNKNTAASSITVTQNVQKAVDKITAFVNKYNELIDKISTKLDEKKNRSYLPLTDDQKSSMKTEEITKWEDKAKTGILRNDDVLSGFTQALRDTLYQAVPGAGMTLSDKIGIGTSNDSTMRGKLVIDQDKLKTALQSNGDNIVKLFTQQSTTVPTYSRTLSKADRDTRTSEEGIFQRISDVIEDYTSTYRDKGNKKGFLIEKAGLVGDVSELTNTLYGDLSDRDKKIDEFTRSLTEKENNYYNKFAKLETAMNNANAQSSWLSKQLGGS